MVNDKKLDPVVYRSIIDLVGPDVQAELISLGERKSELQWRLGDLAVEIKDGVRSAALEDTRYMRITMADVEEFIAELAGTSLRSVRRYEQVCRFWPYEDRHALVVIKPEGRKEIHVDPYEILTLSHFEKAMEYPHFSRELLAATVLEMENRHKGRRPSCKWMDRYAQECLLRLDPGKRIDAVASLALGAIPFDLSDAAADAAQAEPVLVDERGEPVQWVPLPTPDVIINNLGRMAGDILAALDEFERSTGQPVPRYLRERVQLAVAEISDAIVELQDAVAEKVVP